MEPSQPKLSRFLNKPKECPCPYLLSEETANQPFSKMSSLLDMGPTLISALKKQETTSLDTTDLIHQIWKFCPYKLQIKSKCSWLMLRAPNWQDLLCAITLSVREKLQGSTCTQVKIIFWSLRVWVEFTSSGLILESSEELSEFLSILVGVKLIHLGCTSSLKCQHSQL